MVLKVFILHILFVFLLPKYLLRKLCIPLSLKILWDELIYINLYAWIKLFEWTDVSKYYGLSCLLFVLRKLSLNLLMMFYDLICVVFNKSRKIEALFMEVWELWKKEKAREKTECEKCFVYCLDYSSLLLYTRSQ